MLDPVAAKAHHELTDAERASLVITLDNGVSAFEPGTTVPVARGWQDLVQKNVAGGLGQLQRTHCGGTG